ncbi:unnamed protein product [Gulo gulo]|uniref:Peptidyl-prolyl cis-trans isomerase n=1 Tax=Gulo gulo TaxID=48420 RepID=A0A9X9QB46_GULGU|nr:unnamed protein product [Gulo gulo]
MENAGPNKSGSHLAVYTVKTEWLDGKHEVFGKVKEGMNTVEAIEFFGSRDGKTSGKITIADKFNKFDFSFILTTRPFLLQLRRAHLHSHLEISSNICALPAVL